MLAIGTKVKHSGHGLGEIVAYNTCKPLQHVEERLFDPDAVAIAVGLGNALTGALFSGDKYPYVVQYEDGYKDVYAEKEFQVVETK